MKSKKFISNSIIYTLNGLLLKAFNFLLLPLYTIYLTTKDYGTINLITSFVLVANYIVSFSLYSAIMRFYVDIKNDKIQVKRFFGSIIVFVFLSGISFSLLFLIFRNLVISLFLKNLDFYPTVLIVLIGLTFDCLNTVYQYILRSMEKAKKFLIVSLSYFSMQIILNITLVVFLRLGANGVLLATLFLNLLFFIYIIIDLRYCDLLTICIDIPLLKNALKYSIPLLPHNLSAQINSFASKIFINNSFSLSTVGLYGLACQFGSITDMVQSSVNIAFQPWFFDQMNKKETDYKKNIVRVSNFLIWVFGAVFLIIALFSQEAILLFTDKSYNRAWTVVPLIVITYSVKTIYYFYVNILFYYKQATKFIFIATLSSSFIDICLTAILVPSLDMYGSVLADIISMMIRITLVVIMSRRFENIGYNIRNFIYLIILNIIFIGAGLLLSYFKFIYIFNWTNVIFKIGIISIYLAIAIFYLWKHNIISQLHLKKTNKVNGNEVIT